jgi:hypothetical protein
MPNTWAPFGFRASRRQDGAAPNYNRSTYLISSAYATPIFQGDVVVSLSTGYINQATPGTGQIAGIFDGCEYLSVSQKIKVRSPYWPGSDANGDVTAFVIDDPSVVFRVQVGTNGLGPVTRANVMNNINFANGTGNTSTGISGAFADQSTINTTTTLPFKILTLLGDVFIDNTSANNVIEVAFNFTNFKASTLGI